MAEDPRSLCSCHTQINVEQCVCGIDCCILGRCAVPGVPIVHVNTGDLPFEYLAIIKQEPTGDRCAVLRDKGRY